MPRGTRHTLTGTLRWTGQGYALEMEGGGIWQLDVSRNCKRYLNSQVTITGTRAGFDLIDVDTLRPAGVLPMKVSFIGAIFRRK